jgi:hypothetical protein
VIWRQEHEHAGAGRMGFAGAISRNAGAEMAAGDDYRQAAGQWDRHRSSKIIALGVRQGELLRVVGEDANAVGSLVSHAVEQPPLTSRSSSPEAANGVGATGNTPVHLGNM